MHDEIIFSIVRRISPTLHSFFQSFEFKLHALIFSTMELSSFLSIFTLNITFEKRGQTIQYNFPFVANSKNANQDNVKSFEQSAATWHQNHFHFTSRATNEILFLPSMTNKFAFNALKLKISRGSFSLPLFIFTACAINTTVSFYLSTVG